MFEKGGLSGMIPRGGKEGKLSRFIVLIVLIVIMSNISFANVVIFDKYDSETKFEKDKLFVKKTIRIKNVGTTPIIPGELHFKLYQLKKDKKFAPKITEFTVINKYKKELDTRKIESFEEVDLIVNVWDPLLPDFFYDFTMEYEMEFKPSGLFFYELIVPREDTTIPIKNSKTDFLIPKNFFVTYAPNADVEKDGKYKVVSWSDEEEMTVEYSVIPFPNLGIRAVNIFWILMIIVFLGILIWRMAKNRT